MASPLVVEMPHDLGREEVKRRMRARVGELASRIPGGAKVSSSWPSEDRMAIDIRAMGQSIGVLLDVEETLVRATVTLPAMLALMAAPIAAMVRDTGAKLLLGDERGGDKAR